MSNNAEEAAVPRSDRIWTIPNALCLTRLLGSPLLIVLGLLDWPVGLLAMFGFLAFTDFLDGKLAIALNQRSKLGIWLDTWADVTMYASLTAGGLILCWDRLQYEMGWLIPVPVSYAISVVYGFAKFGHWPTYHTRVAKTSWLLVMLGAACVIVDWRMWPFQMAMVAVVLGNIEAILITTVLKERVSDLPSLYHAVQIRRRQEMRMGEKSGPQTR